MLLRYRHTHERKKSNCLRMVSTCAASNVRVNHGYLWLHVPVISHPDQDYGEFRKLPPKPCNLIDHRSNLDANSM